MLTRGIAIAVMLVVAARPVHADDNIAKADQLFEEGRALMKSDLHAACEKFEQSLQFNSQAIGTLMNVALCDEKLGRTASAVKKFTEARDRAREGGLDGHLKAAEERLAELIPKVPHVSIKFLVPPAPGTQIVIDKNTVALDATGDVALDPGEHPLVVSAPNRVAYQTMVRIAEGERRQVDVPELARAITIGGSRRFAGKILTISGGTALATGIVMGLVARKRYNAQFDSVNGAAPPCDSAGKCSPDGQTATENARTLGTVGSVIGGMGVAAAAVGLYLWIRSPKESHPARVTLLPQLDPGSAGVVAVGHF